MMTHAHTHTHTHTHAHQFGGGEGASLLADDEVVPDPQGGEEFPPPLDVSVGLHVAGAQQQPITAFGSGWTKWVERGGGDGTGEADR